MLKKLSVIFMAMILLGSLASPIYAKASTSKTKQVTLTEKVGCLLSKVDMEENLQLLQKRK